MAQLSRYAWWPWRGKKNNDDDGVLPEDEAQESTSGGEQVYNYRGHVVRVQREGTHYRVTLDDEASPWQFFIPTTTPPSPDDPNVYLSTTDSNGYTVVVLRLPTALDSPTSEQQASAKYWMNQGVQFGVAIWRTQWGPLGAGFMNWPIQRPFAELFEAEDKIYYDKSALEDAARRYWALRRRRRGR